MPRSKVSAFFSVLLVFISGAAMGAVGYRLYAVKTVASLPSPSPGKKSPDDVRKLIVNSLNEAVKLDAQQLSDIQRIYEDQFASFNQVHKKYQAQIDQVHAEQTRAIDQIHDASVAKIKALLRAEQLPLYEKWQADRTAAREAEHKRHQQQQQHERPDGRQRPPMPYPLP
jgi:hypothetical protein